MKALETKVFYLVIYPLFLADFLVLEDKFILIRSEQYHHLTSGLQGKNMNIFMDIAPNNEFVNLLDPHFSSSLFFLF